MPRDHSGAGNVAQFPQRETIQAQASAWIARLDGDKLSPREHVEFQHWLNRSPRHRAEIRRLCALWGDLNILTELAAEPKLTAGKRMGGFRIKVAFAVTTALLATILALTVFTPSGPTDATDFYAAEIGAQKTVELGDGSIMQLNTGSHAKVEYSDSRRRILLLKGEAYFDVAPDASRPFLVQAGSNTVRAVGTAFSVHLKQRDLEVLVTEGTVELIAETGPGAAESDPKTPTVAPIAISAGQLAIRTGNDELLQAVTDQEMQRKLAWRQKMLAFSDTPLAEVISEVNRYTAVSIVISDPALSRIRIGGYFKAGETEALLGALESSFGVRVVRVDDKLVYLALAE